jgi:hypothetical protein
MLKIILVLSLLLLFAGLGVHAAEWSRISYSASTELWTGANGIDGNPGSIWSSSLHTAANSSERYAFVFDTFHDVNYIRMTPRFDSGLGRTLGFPKTFTIYYGDGVTWRSIYTVTNMATPLVGSDIIIRLPCTVNCNAIEVVATTLDTDGGSNYVFQMGEFYAGVDNPQPIEWQRTACDVSSALWPAINGMDGDSASVWSSNTHTTPSSPEWYAFWFDGFRDVNYIRMTPRYGGGGFPQTFTLYYNDGVNWNPIRAVTMDKPTTNSDVIIAFPQRIRCNGIKLLASTLGASSTGIYAFQMREFYAGFDPALLAAGDLQADTWSVTDALGRRLPITMPVDLRRLANSLVCSTKPGSIHIAYTLTWMGHGISRRS